MKKLILSILVVALFSSVAFSAGTYDERESLKGLERVYVVVEPLDESHGITRKELQAEVEDRLWKNGVKMLSKEGYLRSKGGQRLYLNVLLQQIKKYTYIAFVSLELKQKVVLSRDPSKSVFATTWEIGGLQVFGSWRFRGAIRKTVKDYVDVFCNDFLAANPKDKPKPAQKK